MARQTPSASRSFLMPMADTSVRGFKTHGAGVRPMYSPIS
jgi:hypothetical protein